MPISPEHEAVHIVVGELARERALRSAVLSSSSAGDSAGPVVMSALPAAIFAVADSRRRRPGEADVGDQQLVSGAVREHSDSRLATRGRGGDLRRDLAVEQARPDGPRGRGRQRRSSTPARTPGGGGRPVTAAQRSISASSAPRLPTGLTSRSRRSRAAIAAARSGPAPPAGASAASAAAGPADARSTRAGARGPRASARA